MSKTRDKSFFGVPRPNVTRYLLVPNDGPDFAGNVTDLVEAKVSRAALKRIRELIDFTRDSSAARSSNADGIDLIDDSFVLWHGPCLCTTLSDEDDGSL